MHSSFCAKFTHDIVLNTSKTGSHEKLSTEGFLFSVCQICAIFSGFFLWMPLQGFFGIVVGYREIAERYMNGEGII